MLDFFIVFSYNLRDVKVLKASFSPGADGVCHPPLVLSFQFYYNLNLYFNLITYFADMAEYLSNPYFIIIFSTSLSFHSRRLLRCVEKTSFSPSADGVCHPPLVLSFQFYYNLNLYLNLITYFADMAEWQTRWI